MEYYNCFYFKTAELVGKYLTTIFMEHPNTIQTPPKSIPPEDLVTVLNVDEHPIELDQNETSLLSLGPGFAVTPKNR